MSKSVEIDLWRTQQGFEVFFNEKIDEITIVEFQIYLFRKFKIASKHEFFNEGDSFACIHINKGPLNEDFFSNLKEIKKQLETFFSKKCISLKYEEGIL